VGIGAAHPGVVGPLHATVEMRHLAQRMNTGVGAPGAGQPHTLAGDLCQRAFQRILQGIAMGLRLPTVKAGAVIFDAKRDSQDQTAEKAATQYRRQ